MNTLKEKFNKEIKNNLVKEMSLNNIWAVPVIKKVVLNMGIGNFKGDKSFKESAVLDLSLIAGQKPIIRKSKKAISNFKLRKGEDVGISVTLREEKMWDFLQNLISVALPRIRDFRGLPATSFDKNGNYSFGIKEHIVFPTIDSGRIDRIKSFQITINTTAKSDKDALILLKSLGVPFKK